MTYAQKLRDPRWLKRRQQVLEASGFVCCWCSSAADDLNVHHGYYEYGKEPWDYDLRTMYCLCPPCHELSTKELKRIRRRLGLLHPKHYSQVAEELERIIESYDPCLDALRRYRC